MRRLALAAVLFVSPIIAIAQTAKDTFMQKARDILGSEYSALLAYNCKVRDLEWYGDVRKAVERAYFYAARQAGIPEPDSYKIRLAINEQLLPITKALIYEFDPIPK